MTTLSLRSLAAALFMALALLAPAARAGGPAEEIRFECIARMEQLAIAAAGDIENEVAAFDLFADGWAFRKLAPTAPLFRAAATRADRIERASLRALRALERERDRCVRRLERIKGSGPDIEAVQNAYNLQVENAFIARFNGVNNVLDRLVLAINPL
jgi:hypothetical protein